MKKAFIFNAAKVMLVVTFSLNAVLMRAFECVVVTTTQKASPNPTIMFLNGEKPYGNAMVVVTQITGENGATKEVMKQRADSKGVIKLKSLELGGSYVVWVLEATERHESLSFEVTAGGMSNFELKFPKPVEPLKMSSLRGDVIDPTGALIARVKIKVESLNTNSQEIREFAADEVGSFVVDLADGEYQVTFTENGFFAATFPVVIKADSTNGWKALRLKMLIGMEDCGGNRSRYEVQELSKLN